MCDSRYQKVRALAEDARQELSKSKSMANPQVNGVTPHLTRWGERLKDLTVSPLTRDYPEATRGDTTRQYYKAEESLEASHEIQHALHKLQSLASPFDLLLTAFVLLVSRLTGDEDIAIGTNTEVNGHPFVLRLPLAPTETFAALVSKVQSVSAT